MYEAALLFDGERAPTRGQNAPLVHVGHDHLRDALALRRERWIMVPSPPVMSVEPDSEGDLEAEAEWGALLESAALRVAIAIGDNSPAPRGLIMDALRDASNSDGLFGTQIESISPLGDPSLMS